MTHGGGGGRGRGKLGRERVDRVDTTFPGVVLPLPCSPGQPDLAPPAPGEGPPARDIFTRMHSVRR